MIIEPTVGRVVHYMAPGQPHELAALVTHVHHSRMVNLTVCQPNGETMAATRVPLCQPGDDANPEDEYCEWMPYQVGQAAKTEDVIGVLTSRVDALAKDAIERITELERDVVSLKAAATITAHTLRSGDGRSDD